MDQRNPRDALQQMSAAPLARVFSNTDKFEWMP
jgi:hypothetical protein